MKHEQGGDGRRYNVGDTVYATDHGRVVAGVVVELPGGMVGVRWEHVQYQDGQASFNLHEAVVTRHEAQNLRDLEQALHERRRRAWLAGAPRRAAEARRRARAREQADLRYERMCHVLSGAEDVCDVD